MKDHWIQQQFEAIDVNDSRLRKRAVTIARACAEAPSNSLPKCFQDWAGVKAAYRFFGNDKVSHQTLQQPHYQNVIEAAKTSSEAVLFIQDGSELLFNSHPWTHGLGPTADSNGNGLMFHSCLVAKSHGQAGIETLGLAYQEAWIRPEKKDPSALKESEVWLRTLERIGEPQANWISVGDRGNDIYSFLEGAENLGWNFVVRARHNRKLEGKSQRLFPWIRELTAKASSKLFVKANGKEFSGEVTLEITWSKAPICGPNGSTSLQEALHYVRIWCPEKPRIEWFLVTNLPVTSEEEALRVIEIYRSRWLIEDYHKALKTGCRIESNQFKYADRILSFFGMLGVIATQLLAVRELCRLSPNTPVSASVPSLWVSLVQRYLKIEIITVRDFWRSVARMGGFLARRSDGEPGWQTIWAGYIKLRDMSLGADLMGQLVGKG